VLAGSAPAKESAETHVDSGSFGIFMAGRRVGTETFTVTQSSSGSKRYEWKEVSPGKASAVVVPNEQFLTQRSIMNPDDKPQEHPYLLPTSTTVLDDYFFIHREILAWKFLATTCKTESGQLKCPLKQRSQFGTMNPHQQSSAPVSMEFLGREKISIRGCAGTIRRNRAPLPACRPAAALDDPTDIHSTGADLFDLAQSGLESCNSHFASRRPRARVRAPIVPDALPDPPGGGWSCRVVPDVRLEDDEDSDFVHAADSIRAAAGPAREFSPAGAGEAGTKAESGDSGESAQSCERQCKFNF